MAVFYRLLMPQLTANGRPTVGPGFGQNRHQVAMQCSVSLGVYL